MDESRRISTRVLRLATKLLVAFVLLVGPYAQAASTGGQSAVPDHHAAMSMDAGGPEAAAHEHHPEAEAATDGEAGSGPIKLADKCCDLFCMGVACIVPTYALASREPVSVSHDVIDANVAPGEWVLPHRPPNA
jgi:hypothetical protein